MPAMKPFFVSAIFLLFSGLASAQFSISNNHRFLLKDGQPFFWLGDTGWELFHRLDREEADYYLQRRAEQGFTVIQAVAIAELDGLHTGNAYGERPLIDDDLTRPNEKYFEHVDYIIDKAASCGLTIALLPIWGDKLFKSSWGKGPEILNQRNAAIYGGWLARRYKDRRNIVWVLGGDRMPRDSNDVAVWSAMGDSIMQATAGRAIISVHVQPNEEGSAKWFRGQSWFAFNMFQNGHCRNGAGYEKIAASYRSVPVRPVLDGEPLYEDHPVCFNSTDLGFSSAYDVRIYAYTEILAGAFGHTYGCNSIWQMYAPGREPMGNAHASWKESLDLPGGRQMGYLHVLFAKFDLLSRIPDQSLIAEGNEGPAERIQAARGNGYALVYTVAGKAFTAMLEKIGAPALQASWFDPRTGKEQVIEGAVDGHGQQRFSPPSSGYGQDWLLVLRTK